MHRPAETEYAPSYRGYIAHVTEEEIVPVLRSQLDDLELLLGRVAPERETYRYADGKWSIREIAGHLIDGERVFGYRAFCIARGETQNLPGFDQNDYMLTAPYDGIELEDLLAEFRLVRLANIDIRRNAQLIIEMMQRRGLNPRVLETATKESPPAVYGEWKVPGATRSIVFYAHYDGQPTDPKQWTGTMPWQPVWRSGALESGGRIMALPADGAINPEWRLYARSASDDKAGVMAILTAFDALRAQGITPALNIKFIFEGEEEAGSPHLGEIIDRHKDLLSADAWIICDGPVHQSGRKQAVFGVRGDVNVDVTVYGAKRPLHSGHYGNWAPNPAMLLARLLSSMKDDTGRVTIAGWYEGVEPLGQAEQKAIADAPAYDDELRSQLGFARADGAGKSLLELINQPSLNINGFSSGDVGALARNVIPTTASVVLDLRLVRGNDFRRQVQRLIDHVRKQGFFVIDRDPTD